MTKATELPEVNIGMVGHVDHGKTTLTQALSGKWTDLVTSSKAALDAVLKMIAPGVKIGEIGKTVQETIQGYDFSPVRNLSGHGIGHFEVHTKPTMPNIDTREQTELVEEKRNHVQEKSCKQGEAK